MKATDILKPYSAVVVDSDEATRRILVAILRGFGLSGVYATPSAERAKELIAGGRVDLAIMDRFLENSEPFGLLSDLRWSKDFPKRDVPVIICTGYTLVDEIFEARDNGADEIIAKPIDVKQALKKIGSALFERRPFVDSVVYAGPCRRRRRSQFTGDDRRRVGKKQLEQRDIDKVMGYKK